MYDLDAINAEQLVTRTDLVLRGNLTSFRKKAAVVRLGRGSQNFSVAARHAIAAEERTVFVRNAEARSYYVLCAAASIAWICVAAVCLLA